MADTFPALHPRLNWDRRRRYLDQVMALSPIAYWRLGEASGTIAYDHAGGLHGTINNAPTLGVTGALAEDTDKAITFAGSPQSVTAAPVDISVTNPYTMALWASCTPDGTFRRIMAIEDASGYGANLQSQSGYLMHVRTNAAGSDYAYQEAGLTAGWHFIVATYDGTTMRLYLDGMGLGGVGIGASARALTAPTTTVIGGNLAGTNFIGTLDEVGVWNRALTSAEIASFYAVGKYGEYGGAYCDLGTVGTFHPPNHRLTQMDRTVGMNAALSGDATGTLSFTANNHDDWWTPDRNLAVFASFDGGLGPWSTAAVTGLTLASTSLEWGLDAPTACGTHCGILTLPANDGAGCYQALEGTWYNGVAMTAEIAIKSLSGTTHVEIGVGSIGTPADLAVSATTITGSWVRYHVHWTPSADRTDAAVFVRSHAASAGVCEIAALQVNMGATALTYQEAPVKWMFGSGIPIHMYATMDGTNYPRFTGRVQRIAPQVGADMRVQVTCHDMTAVLGDTLVDVDSANGRTHRQFRAEIIDAAVRTLEGSRYNLCANGDFETHTDGWAATRGAISASATIAQFGTKSLRIVGSGAATGKATFTDTTQLVKAGRVYCVSGYLAKYGNTTQAYFQVGAGTNVTNKRQTMSTVEDAYQQSDLSWSYVTRQVAGSEYTVTDVTRVDTIQKVTGVADWPALSASMQRFSFLWRCLADGYLLIYLEAGNGVAATDGVYADGIMVTEGPTLWPYIAPSSPVGRQPNMLPNGSFTTDRLPWDRGYGNLCGNSVFASDTAGWAVSADGFISSATAAIVRSGAGPAPYTAGMALITAGATNGDGTHYDITGTFYAGHTYIVRVWCNGLAGTWSLGIGSTGTPADTATVALASGAAASVTWTPTGNRTDAHLYVKHTSGSVGNTCYVTGFYVAGYYFVAPSWTTSADVLEPNTYVRTADALSPTGYCCVVTPYAVAGSGVYSTIGHGTMVAGRSGVPYTASVWVWTAAGTASVTIGVGSPATPADHADTTITATTTPVRYSLTWTPSGNRTDAIMWLAAGGAAADAFRFSGASFTLGKGLQDYEPAQCSGLDATETDIAPVTVLARANALGSLQAVNAATMTHHWIEATMSPPWWTYNSASRGRVLAVSEDYDGSLAGVNGIPGLTGVEDDVDRIVNEVTVSYAPQGYQPDVVSLSTATAGAIVAYDLTSQLRTGSIKATSLGSTTLVNAPVPASAPDTSAQAIADYAKLRYATPSPHPTLHLVNHFPTCLSRDPMDLVTVSLTRSHWSKRPFLGCTITDHIMPMQFVQDIVLEGR
jgi:hypothetical protein